jgi:hypothetical protein
VSAKKIIVGTLAVLVLAASGATGYAYYVGNSTYPDADVVSKIKYGFANLKKSATAMTGTEKKDDINFLFGLTADITVKKDGKTTDRTDIKIENGGILSRSDGLQQRIKLGKIELTSSGKTSENFSLKDLDVVSDNEKVYSFVGEGMDKLLSGSGTVSAVSKIGGKGAFISQLKGIYSQKKYAMFDNSKPMLRVLGDYANDELIRKIAVSLATSNPQAYFQKVGGNEDLKKFFLSDKAIGFVFQDGSQNSDGTKTNLTLNAQACKNLAPLMANLAKEVGEMQKDDSVDEFVQECEKSIGELQPFLSIATQIYKEGDVKAGNYKFVIAQGNIFELTISYKNHAVEKWSVNGNDPKGQFTLKGNGDIGTISNSLLKINLDLPAEYGSPSMKISGEIKDGSGKIEMSLSGSGSESELPMARPALDDIDSEMLVTPVLNPTYTNARGFVEMKDYGLAEIDLSGTSTGSTRNPDFDFAVKGTGTSGKAEFHSIKNGIPQEKMEFSYDVPAGKYQLDLDSKDLSGSAKYDKSVFAMNLVQKDFDGGEMGKMDMELNIPASTFHLNADSKFIVLKSKYAESAFSLEFVQKGFDGTDMVK